MDYRLLNKGERLQNGDDVYNYLKCLWEPVPTGMIGDVVEECYTPRRRAIDAPGSMSLDYFLQQQSGIFSAIEELKITEPEGSMLGRVTSLCDHVKVLQERNDNQASVFNRLGDMLGVNVRTGSVERLYGVVRKLLDKVKQKESASPWIALSERKPIKEDADKDGYVLVVGGEWFVNTVKWDRIQTGSTHWMPIPPLPKEKEVEPPSKSIQAFEQAWSKYSTIGPLQIMRGDTPLTTKENARKIWNAAILHVAERFMSKSDTTLPNLD